MRWLVFTALAAVAVFSALNWRAQIQTQQKLDALAAAFAERPAVPTPAEAVAPLPAPLPKPGEVPRELSHVVLPQSPYVIEAPDVLTVEVVVKDPKTGLTSPLPVHPVSGQFVVRPDGTIGLGAWGTVLVTGQTIEQAVAAVRKQFTKTYLAVPEANLVIALDVLAYNSKRYYVVADGPGAGEQVYPLPLTGNETVLDALGNVNVLLEAAGKRRVWVARRTSNPGQPWQILPVDWDAITQRGITKTNYQIMPGDRVYIKRAAD